MAANEKQLQLSKQGAEVFNNWRQQHSEKIDLNFAKLSGADLRGANLSGANLTAATLTGADLTGADLTEADLWHADLTGANLSGANLKMADLKGANFTRAILTDSNLSEAAILQEINLTETKLSGIDFQNADLTRATFNRANLRQANFTNANLWGAHFVEADLTGANFSFANLYYCHLERANLTNANLTKANLNAASLPGADLTGAILREAIITNANLREADLTRADLYNTNLTGSNFFKVNLSEADISHAFRNHQYDQSTHSLHDWSASIKKEALLKADYKERGYLPPFVDFVKCSVFAPVSALPGKTVMVQVFAHCYGEEEVVRNSAIQFDEKAKLRGSKSLEQEIKKGTELTFYLAMEGVKIDDPIQKLVWLGAPESVQFGVYIPDDHSSDNVIGTVYVTENNIPFGHVKFLLTVEAALSAIPANERPETTDAWKRYEHAFISYASPDRTEVLKRVQMLPRVGIKVFQDLLSLEPGERWEKALYKYIDKSDVFFLFWSNAAKNSQWVMQEVIYAMKKKVETLTGNPEIIPIIIEGPPPVPPPPELKDIHFNDVFIYFISSH